MTPEFFYLPDFLLNKNHFDFGEGQNGDVISSVALPTWANSPYEFVFRHRQALESEHVSRNLHKWVDLIFGSKQKGQAAKDADNVFSYLTYEGNVNLLEIKDKGERSGVFEQIAEYGQTPHQIMISDHPPKEIFRFDKTEMLKSNDNSKMSWEFIQDAPFSVQKIAFSNNLREVSIYYSNNSLLFMPMAEIDLSSDLNQASKHHMLLDRKHSIQIPSKLASNNFIPGSQIYFFRSKKRTFLVGGFYDCTLKVYHRGKEISQNLDFKHRKPISCVSVCEECKIVACGSMDCRISLWQYDKEMILTPSLDTGGLIYGHNNEVVLLKIDEVLDVLVSVDKDGVVLLHEIRRGRFVMKIQVGLGREEDVSNLDIHENGLILVGTNENRVVIYSLNGELLNEFRIGMEKMRYRVMGARFVSKWMSFLMIGDNEGNLMIYDAFRKEVIINFFSFKMIFFA